MPDKVFISHSSKDKEIADAICQHLESAGVLCWIAPRDSLGYFLESVHWLDATKSPVEQHLPVLTERVKALLNGGGQTLLPVFARAASA